MAHITVAAGEEILDKEIKVLDHGFVRLVDYMGSDARIVQTARVSYGEGTKTLTRRCGIDRLSTPPRTHLSIRARCF